MEQTVRHARPQRWVPDDMLPGGMLRATTEDSTMPARILQKPVLTIIVADGKFKGVLHAVQEKPSRFARPVMVRIIGAAVGVLAVVGAVN